MSNAGSGRRVARMRQPGPAGDRDLPLVSDHGIFATNQVHMRYWSSSPARNLLIINNLQISKK
jgi:hypothetical protein